MRHVCSVAWKLSAPSVFRVCCSAARLKILVPQVIIEQVENASLVTGGVAPGYGAARWKQQTLTVRGRGDCCYFQRELLVRYPPPPRWADNDEIASTSMSSVQCVLHSVCLFRNLWKNVFCIALCTKIRVAHGTRGGFKIWSGWSGPGNDPNLKHAACRKGIIAETSGVELRAVYAHVVSTCLFQACVRFDKQPRPVVQNTL